MSWGGGFGGFHSFSFSSPNLSLPLKRERARPDLTHSTPMWGKKQPSDATCHWGRHSLGRLLLALVWSVTSMRANEWVQRTMTQMGNAIQYNWVGQMGWYVLRCSCIIMLRPTYSLGCNLTARWWHISILCDSTDGFIFVALGSGWVCVCLSPFICFINMCAIPTVHQCIKLVGHLFAEMHVALIPLRSDAGKAMLDTLPLHWWRPLFVCLLVSWTNERIYTCLGWLVHCCILKQDLLH